MKKSQRTKTKLLSSLVLLLLSMTMFLGTTFAWFTDSVTSTGNIIKAGNLDVEMYYADVTANPEDEKTTWTDASIGAIFKHELWEPGYTTAKHIKIENKGTLALKYEINIVPTGEVSNLADVIDVYYADPAVQAVNRGAAADDKDYKLGTLTEVLDGLDAAGKLLPGKSHTITLALKMQETAGNEYQGKEIGSDFAVQLVATQASYEEDAFGKDYDANAEFPVLVSSAEELATALKDGGNYMLAADLDLGADKTLVVENGKKEVKLDLNGHTIGATNTRTETHNNLFLVEGGNLTVTNGTVEFKHTGENMAWAKCINTFNVTAGGVLTLEGVTVKASGTDMNFAVHLNNWGEVTLNANNCVFDSTYCGVRAFNSGYDMNNITITNSTLKGATRAFWVHNYIGDLKPSDHSEEAIKARLNLDIYNNNNTFEITGTATSPIRYGFNNTVYYDVNGNLIPLIP